VRTIAPQSPWDARREAGHDGLNWTKVFQTFPRISKLFQGNSKLFQAFSKEFQTFSLAASNEIKGLAAAPVDFAFF